MMKPLVVSLLETGDHGSTLAEQIDGELAQMELRFFPDGEAYIRIDSPVQSRNVVVLATLDDPNRRFLPLMFVAETLRDLEAASIGLAAPYLPYMRQDARFRPGEGLTSHFFARLLSRSFDWLVTVDPHLHRIESLDEIYSIETEVVQAAGPIAQWIREHVQNPLLIGPDEESEQWVGAVAAAGNLPKLILSKSRHGDYDVQVRGGPAPTWADQRPVIIDDIISTGRTMLEAVKVLQDYQMKPPICIGIHGLFVGDAREVIGEAPIDRLVTTNTVDDPSNGIDIFPEFARGVGRMLGR